MLSIPAALIPIKNTMRATLPFLIFVKIEIGTDTLYIVNDLQDKTWDGQTWTALPFEISTLSEGTGQEVPQSTLIIANPMRIFQSYLEEYNGTAGGKASVYILYSANTASGSADILMKQYYIMGVAVAESDQIQITLTSDSPWRKRCPLNRIRRNFCRFRFKSTACAYAGAETTCDKTLQRCTELANVSNFGAFPGAGRGIPGLRI